MRFTACPLLTASVSYDSFPRRKFFPEMPPPRHLSVHDSPLSYRQNCLSVEADNIFEFKLIQFTYLNRHHHH